MSVLCITRYPEESVVLDHGETRIKITVVKIRKNGMTRLAIEAPLHVRIMRSELLTPDGDMPLHPDEGPV